MSKVFQFKIAFITRKDLWRRIEIRDDQELGEFDHFLRDIFHHDPDDHLSEFFRGRPWRSEGFGEISPYGNGEDSDKRISMLNLSIGDTMTYVYDFGDDIRHTVKLEKIKEPKKRIKYPRVIDKNKPRYRNCEKCLKKGRKKKAIWLYFSHEQGKELLLCSKCLNKESDDGIVEKIVY